MGITLAQMIGAVLAVAILLGGLLVLLSFVVPRLRFSRGHTVADRDETGIGGPKLPL